MAKQSTGWAVVGTIPILGFILVMVSRKTDKYALFYGRQGLMLGLATIVLNFILTALVVTFPLVILVNIASFVLWIISVVNAASGKMKPTPIVGQLAKRFGL